MTDSSPEIMIAQEVTKIHTELKVDDRVSIEKLGTYENGIVHSMAYGYVFVQFWDTDGRPSRRPYHEVNNVCYQYIVCVSDGHIKSILVPVRIFRA